MNLRKDECEGIFSSNRTSATNMPDLNLISNKNQQYFQENFQNKHVIVTSMRLLFLVKLVSRICGFHHTYTEPHYRCRKKKGKSKILLSKLYRTHNTPRLYLTKLPQSSRVRHKIPHTPFTPYRIVSHTEMAIYNSQTFFKLFLRNLQNDAYCISKQPVPVMLC